MEDRPQLGAGMRRALGSGMGKRWDLGLGLGDAADPVKGTAKARSWARIRNWNAKEDCAGIGWEQELVGIDRRQACGTGARGFSHLKGG